MQTRDAKAVGLLVVLMLTVWLGFLVHRSPRFAGSGWGGFFGVSGAALMLVPLATYMVVKRVKRLKRRVTRLISMPTLLSIHIYTALTGSILVLLHSGHKFDSPLGMALTGTVLLAVMSGFVGRYLMTHINRGLREKRDMLQRLKTIYEAKQVEFSRSSLQLVATTSDARETTSEAGPDHFGTPPSDPTPSQLNDLVGGIADLEYSIAVHDQFKSWFLKWLTFHKMITIVLCALLAFHVASGIYYGLRWFE